LRFTAPDIIAKAAQMITPEYRKSFGLIKNIFWRLIFETNTDKNFFFPIAVPCKKLKIDPAQKLLNACKEETTNSFFEIKVVQH
jgi:hypothetical protein